MNRHLFQKVLLMFLSVTAILVSSFVPHQVYAAANIAISTPVIAVDGKTITATLSGGTGNGYTITNTAGLKITNQTLGNTVYQILSATVSSGNVLTLKVGFPISFGQGITLDVDATNTISDSGTVNRAQVQSLSTASSLYNNSTNLAMISDPNILSIGSYTTTTVQAHTVMNTYSFGMRFDFKVHGATDVAIAASTLGGTSMGVIIDGVASTITLPTVPSASNYWGVFPIAMGLDSNTDHTISLIPAGAYISIGQGVLSQSFLLLGGSNAVLVPTTGFGTQYWLSDAPFTTYGALDGSPTSITGAGGNHLSYGMQGGQAIRFASNTSLINIWGTVNPITYVLYQDGTPIRTGTTPTSAYPYSLFKLATGLDTTTTHEYEIVIASPLIPTNCYVAMIELDGNGIAPIKHAPRPIEVFYGDSITAQVGITDATKGDAFIMARAIGSTTSVRGASNMNASTYGRDHTGDILANASRVWERFGHNDNYHNVPIGAIGSAGTFKGDFYTMLVNIRARIGAGKPIMVEQMFPTTIANRTLYNTAMADVVTAYKANTADKFVKVINTDNWINPTAGVDTADGTHPNASGYAKIANREIPFAATDGYSEQGPYHGTVSVPSANYTLTLAFGAKFTGDTSITISDGGNGGIITPSVGNPGTSTVTVTPPAGATSFTFTYTPTLLGKQILKFTNSAGWGNPGEMMYMSEKPAVPDHRPPGGIVLL